MSATWTHIHFNLLEVDINALFEIEAELRESEGVSFDTGCWMTPEGPREWHTDWSLEGTMSVEDLAKYLDDKSVPYTLVKVLNHQEEE